MRRSTSVAAKPQSHPGETTGLATHHTSTRGTLAYMAPEQLRGEPVDPRSDLFAFGIVLTQLVTGRHPFGEASGIELASAILQSDPRPWPPGRAMPPLLPNIADRP
jgi:serine/threonine-protein kinase